MAELRKLSVKNEVRCRNDTMPKAVDTRRHCKVGFRACNNQTEMLDGIVEDCCMFSTLPCSNAFLCLKFLYHFYILLQLFTRYPQLYIHIICISYNTPSSDMVLIYQPYLERGVL